ncbi:MAG: TIGR03087 family PEP-CTERM/XrtA system glycosyltransferase [Desulfobacterales bacterium]|nr:TIGR03087 family PEP-CTERM/XrtA system glycosyltransferase [Desulfobacterales bacterium]
MGNGSQHRKPGLLFLCHRIPFPPNKGDKIRAFHLLKHLHKHFDISLATFVDDKNDWAYAPQVRKYCNDSLFVNLVPWLATLRSLWGFMSGKALSVPFYTNNEMSRWVENVIAEREIENVIVYSSAMAQFVPATKFSFQRQVLDFVDIDSDKWAQYAERKSWPMNWLYQREANKLLQLEKELAEQFDIALFVSSSEAEMFKQLSPSTAHKIGFYNNGVNTDYFNSAQAGISPYENLGPVIVFTGAMDYWPNVDAVEWFVKEVFPGLKEKIQAIQFFIVGGNPAKSVKQLARLAGVTVTGRVDDVRPYIAWADAAVAPMRVARGVQNKVLEAMAMEKPVLVSSKGLEGIDAVDGEHLLLANEPSDYSRLLSRILDDDFPDIGVNARSHVATNFNWDENLPEVVTLLGVDTRGETL